MATKRKLEEDVSSTSDSKETKKQATSNSGRDAEPSSSAGSKTAENNNTNNDAATTTKQQNDESYFKAYSDLLVHQDMIDDSVRTNTYRCAILHNYHMFYNKTVLDIGCGTGILSLFCVQAGAKKVYAVDASSIVDVARQVVRANNADHKIVVIHGKMEDVQLPEKVDIIVSEWMGYMLLYECMLASVIDARDKWLRQNGRIFPSHAQLYLAPITDYETYNERVTFWEECRDRYKIDLSAIIPFAQRKMIETVHVHTMNGEDIQAHSEILKDIDLLTVTLAELQQIKSRFDFRCFGHSTIHGFCLWFSVSFPGGYSLSTAPYDCATHWQQTVLFTNPFGVRQDTKIRGSFSIVPNSGNNRFLDLSLRYYVDDGDVREHKYVMSDSIF